MVIDVHTHVYPDKIAARTVALLQSVENHPVYSDGTLKGLKEAMTRSCVDLSVVLPVMTKPSQFESILSFAVEVNNTPASVLTAESIRNVPILKKNWTESKRPAYGV